MRTPFPLRLPRSDSYQLLRPISATFSSPLPEAMTSRKSTSRHITFQDPLPKPTLATYLTETEKQELMDVRGAPKSVVRRLEAAEARANEAHEVGEPIVGSWHRELSFWVGVQE